MTDLEKYIRENAEDFNFAEIPAGSRERFLRKIDSVKRIRRLIFSLAIPVAASLVFLIYLSMPSTLETELRKLAENEVEVINRVTELCPDEVDNVLDILHAITYEAIPIEEQLPEVLSQKEREKIIEDYYQEKIKAVEYLMEQYLKSE